MSLENPDVIDIITQPEPDKLELVITDAGVTTDPRERLDLLMAKLRNYVGYILSEDFADEHPELGPEAVSIAVVSATPPTADMLQISHVKPRSRPGRLIPVRFLRFVGGQTTAWKTESPEVDRSKILPRLVTAEFVARANAENELPHRPLGGTGLFVAYVEDGENSVRFVMGPLVEEICLDEAGLYELALANLGKTLNFGDSKFRESLRKPNITTIKCMDSFDAARLLLLPQHLEPGEAIVALVPDRDTLTLLPVPADGNWARIAELAKVPAGEHLLLDRPLKVTRDGFEVI
jgi:hypothetical protein